MKPRTFRVGQQASGYTFSYDNEGGLRAHEADEGAVFVIGGQTDLRSDVQTPTEWTDADDATGNNSKISDGKELYVGAGFGDPLIVGQVEDVLWAIGVKAGRPSGRLLEVGCGPGFLLEALQERLPGWTLTGVDPSHVSVGQAKSRGLDVREGFVDSVDLEPGFDAIVVMGNFQLHVDQAQTLTALAKLASSGACLYLDSKNPRTSSRLITSRLVGIPGLNRIGAIHSAAAHAFHGTRSCPAKPQLVRMLSEAGWSVEELRTTAPRLLRFGNSHRFSRGVVGLAWRATDLLDEARDSRAWIQIKARRN